ncbi:MAG: bifunctional oligoribonuclease/PAP phosphatase NrnA [Bacillota bacterium]
MTTVTERDKIIEILKEEPSFYLISHMQPDGDSIGSLLATGESLRSCGKQVSMFAPDQVPQKYLFLQGADRVLQDVLIDNPEITVVVLDSSDLERLSYFKEAVTKCKQVINIDHHVTNQKFGTYNLIESEAAATGEIIYGLLKELNAPLTKDVVESLYVAISTDTGSFKYENTTPDTHRVVASLLEYGINASSLSQKIFDQRSMPFYMMLKEALAGLEIYESGKIALATLSKDIRERCGASPGELEGIVNYTRDIEGVELGILFYVENSREVKIGFRSKIVDVSELAGRFNGGGHARAAGCRLYEDYKTVKQKVLEQAIDILEELPV